MNSGVGLAGGTVKLGWVTTGLYVVCLIGLYVVCRGLYVVCLGLYVVCRGVLNIGSGVVAGFMNGCGVVRTRNDGVVSMFCCVGV